ncbi:MAG: sterol desaturase family protein [Spongiibacteraceae bacterium]
MTSMTTASMQAFRSRYRAAISPRYNGWLHMFIVAAIGTLVIAGSLSQLIHVSTLEWLTVPVTLLVVNFGEYYAHRWLGHRKTNIGKLFYQRHTGDHHSFFLDSDMDYQSSRDWRVVLFPSYLILAFSIGLVLPGIMVLLQLATSNIAYLYAATAIGGYLFYEVMHFSYHIPRDGVTEKLFLYIPGWKIMREHHRLHHRRDKMAVANFNITLPVFDLLLGSYDHDSDVNQKITAPSG